MQRILKIRTELCFGEKHECMPQTYSLFKVEGDSYFIRHWKVNYNYKRRCTKHPLQTCDVEPILEQLFQIKLPIAPEPIHGCDGGYTEIHLGDHWAESKFRWWSVPPEGWERLDKLVQTLLGLIEAHEPVTFQQAIDLINRHPYPPDIIEQLDQLRSQTPEDLRENFNDFYEAVMAGAETTEELSYLTGES